VKDLETIMGSLQRDPAEVRDFIENIDPNSDGRISFDEFLHLMQQVEDRIVKNGLESHKQVPDSSFKEGSARGVIKISADDKVLDFLKLLEEYRRKCEE